MAHKPPLERIPAQRSASEHIAANLIYTVTGPRVVLGEQTLSPIGRELPSRRIVPRSPENMAPSTSQSDGSRPDPHRPYKVFPANNFQRAKLLPKPPKHLEWSPTGTRKMHNITRIRSWRFNGREVDAHAQTEPMTSFMPWNDSNRKL
jgi:hypothetical protein